MDDFFISILVSCLVLILISGLDSCSIAEDIEDVFLDISYQHGYEDLDRNERTK